MQMILLMTKFNPAESATPLQFLFTELYLPLVVRSVRALYLTLEGDLISSLVKA
jgi:hypothetical protein